jgi:hypothetical protein
VKTDAFCEFHVPVQTCRIHPVARSSSSWNSGSSFNSRSILWSSAYDRCRTPIGRDHLPLLEEFVDLAQRLLVVLRRGGAGFSDRRQIQCERSCIHAYSIHRFVRWGKKGSFLIR